MDNRHTHSNLGDIVAYVPKVAKIDVTIAYLARRFGYFKFKFCLGSFLLGILFVLSLFLIRAFGLSSRHRFVRVDSSATLLDIADLLAKYKSHRVPVSTFGVTQNIK